MHTDTSRLRRFCQQRTFLPISRYIPPVEWDASAVPSRLANTSVFQQEAASTTQETSTSFFTSRYGDGRLTQPDPDLVWSDRGQQEDRTRWLDGAGRIYLHVKVGLITHGNTQRSLYGDVPTVAAC